MERQWIQYPKDIELQTAYGPVFLNVVKGDYVYVDASGNGKFITVGGKHYGISVRLVSRGAAWELLPDANGRTYDAVYARKHMFFGSDDRMPPSYQAKAVAEIIRVVSAYLAANPQLTHVGAVADASNDLAREEGTLAELEAKVAEQRKKVNEADRAYSRALGGARSAGVDVGALVCPDKEVA